MSRLNFIAIVIICWLGLAGCSDITKSASQAFDNANSVITSSSPKLWGTSTETEESTTREKNQRELDQENK